MDRLETYDYLMGIIDRWTVEKPEEQRGAFKHLQEGALVRETVVTPGSNTSVPRLKTCFSTEILEIYPSKTRITWSDIRRALAKETDKKYNFDFRLLNQCLLPEENRKAVRKLPLLAECGQLADDIEEWDDLPVFLLERLQELFRKKLGRYWRICHQNAAGSNPKNNGEKKEAYLECVRTLALHEIFVRELLAVRERMMEEAEQHHKELEAIPDRMEDAVSQFGRTEEHMRKESAEQVRSQTRESIKTIQWYGKFCVFLAVCLEHMISLGAEIQVIMLLEKKRLEEIDERKKNSKYEIERYLEFMKEQYLTGVEKYNKNKWKYYSNLENRVKNLFFHYVKQLSGSGRHLMSDALETYLRIVEQGKWNEKQAAELWNAQILMAVPLFKRKEETDETSCVL